MVSYCVRRLEQPDWGHIPSVNMQHAGWLIPNNITAAAQICHNADRIFVRMEATEENIRATVTDSLAIVCEDSCLEFFFAPVKEDSRYLNFEFNPLGTMYLGFGGERETRVRQLPANISQFRISPFRTAKGWGISFAIPVNFIKMYFPNFSFQNPACGNFYKCGDLTPSPHYLAWSPLQCSKPDFHRRSDFGILEFE